MMSTAARQLCLEKEFPGFCSEICRTLKPSSDSFELEEGYLVFPQICLLVLGEIWPLSKPHHTYSPRLSWLQQQ